MRMPLDPYFPCPCGSGKKFKWCCQPIHVQIDKAFQQDADGQHEAALRTMEEVTAEHSGNPEAWGRKAELLYNAGKTEEAETALQKAFDLFPKYPFGHLLRGSFRRSEGEIPGALILFRKAADYYDPEAKAILAQIHTLIFDGEMKLNHPVAARAAAQLALRFNPASEDLRKGMDAVFGPGNPNLPEAARREHKFQPGPAAGERHSAWESALGSAATGKLTDAARAFEQLTGTDPDNAAAWYNLGLAKAWLGNNLAAVEALERYVVLETDEARAAAAWTLAEVLRCGQGMEDHADIVEYSLTIPLQDPQAFVNTLTALDQEGLLAGAQVREEEGVRVLTGVILEMPPPALTPELEAKQSPRLGAYLALMSQILRLWNVNKESLDRSYQILRERGGRAMGEPYPMRGPAKFFDVMSECLIFPRLSTEAELETRMRSHLESFFEESWLHRPLKSLGQTPPIDAAGHPTLRKKLRGLVQFLEDCARLTKFPYDFDRLRRQLNLLDGKIEAATDSSGQLDVKALGTAELVGLAVDTLSDGQLDDAFQTALKLDARDRAGKFARALASRPARADKPDRYPLFNHLIGLAQGQGDFQAALDLVNEGEKDDCEHNEGRRRNDYELRRGQLLVKSGDIGQAQEVLDRLLARVPDDLRVRGSATEALISAKQGTKALAYAEQGLAAARKQNQRDSEQYFLELQAAAKKQAGG